MYNRNPKVIYRRISKHRYRSPKPKYGPPRITYGPPRPKKLSHKKVKPTYGPPKHKKRTTKPRYGPPKHRRPKYGPPKKKKIPPISYYQPEPVGFGEPPAEYPDTFQPPKPTYAEPPVDSYGAPLKTIPNEPYPTAPSFPDSPNIYDNPSNNYQSWNFNQHDQSTDNSYAFSKHHPAYVKPSVFEDHRPQVEYSADSGLNSYADVFKYDQNKYYLVNKKKRPDTFKDGPKIIRKPWRGPSKNQQFDDQIIVGGQYAEPPGRYVPKFQPSSPMYIEDEDFSPPDSFVAPEATSSTISPYVNYKNSNMAFSPQNLNDAFSIVDK